MPSRRFSGIAPRQAEPTGEGKEGYVRRKGRGRMVCGNCVPQMHWCAELQSARAAAPSVLMCGHCVPLRTCCVR
eukprot:3937428-Alexandrium_andersonii.AAC.1